MFFQKFIYRTLFMIRSFCTICFQLTFPDDWPFLCAVLKQMSFCSTWGFHFCLVQISSRCDFAGFFFFGPLYVVNMDNHIILIPHIQTQIGKQLWAEQININEFLGVQSLLLLEIYTWFLNRPWASLGLLCYERNCFWNCCKKNHLWYCYE